jgi:hypothetical protein
LVNRYGSARAALAALPSVAGRGRSVRIATEDEIAREMEAAAHCGARFVAIGESDYPALLRRIDSAPPLIALRGDAAIFARPAVAIVGARNASGAGLAFAEASRVDWRKLASPSSQASRAASIVARIRPRSRPARSPCWREATTKSIRPNMRPCSKS